MSIFAPAPPPARIYLEDEGVQLPVRSRYDFQGSGVTVTDDAANGQTVVTIPGGGSTDFAAMGIYRPQDYGTIDPTGASDSSTAIQAALNAMNASNYGGVVDIPPGRYKISTGLTLTDPGYDSTHGWGYQYGRKIRGLAWGATTLVANSGLTSPILTVTGNTNPGLPNIDIQDIGFNGNANTGMTNGVVKLQNLAFVRVQRVVIQGAIGGSSLAPIGLNCLDVITSVFDQVHINNAGVGWSYLSAPTFTNALTNIRNCLVVGCSDIGLDFIGPHLVVQGMDFEGGALATAALRVRNNASYGSNTYAFDSGTGTYSLPWGYVDISGPMHYEGAGTPVFDLDCKHARIKGPMTGMGTVQNRYKTNLVLQDCTQASVTNATNAVLRLERCPGASYSGGTTTVGY